MINFIAYSLFKQNCMVLGIVIAFLVSISMSGKNLWFYHPSVTNTISTAHSTSSLVQMAFDGNLSFENIEHVAKDFGNRYHMMPLAVLYPKSVSDISSVVKHIYEMGQTSEITVAARGQGHSLQGQAQAHRGVVINMESLLISEMRFHTGNLPYVDVSAGELWINILHESLKHGLAPKSWTDYLHLTVGGTLSNGGIGGQAFRHGTQINNVYQLQIVTGTGKVLTCSERKNSDLFNAALGGLGQFGIITSARIALEPAPRKVKWIRVLYSDFSIFCNDQEHLISNENSFDYVEGFVITNFTGLLDNWRSSFDHNISVKADQFISEGRILYCLEVAKYFNPEDSDHINQDIDMLLAELNYIRSIQFHSEVSYIDFLDRVHVTEIRLEEKGLWDVPHPWLNFLIPRSSIHKFAKQVFGNILKDTSNGPVLIYPVNKSRWKNTTSMVTPEEDVFYLVAFLSSAIPSSTGKDGLQHILAQNERILCICNQPHLGIKQYLPHYVVQEEWRAHFGTHWEVFSKRKMAYDPLAILAPGQRIFQKAKVAEQL